MCGGSSGLFGTGLFADKAPAAVKFPKPEVAAAPAPERKQDTGAIVAVGNSEDEADARRRASSYGSKRKGGSSVGGLTAINPIL